MGRRLSGQTVALLASAVATDCLPLSCRASPNRCVGGMNAPSDTRAASHGNRYDSLFPNGLPGNSRLTAVRYAASHPSQRLYSPSTYPLSQTRRCTLWAVSHSLRGSPLRLACDLPDDTSYVINLIFFIPAWSRTMHLAPQGSAQDVPRVALLGVVDTS